MAVPGERSSENGLWAQRPNQPEHVTARVRSSIRSFLHSGEEHLLRALRGQALRRVLGLP